MPETCEPPTELSLDHNRIVPAGTEEDMIESGFEMAGFSVSATIERSWVPGSGRIVARGVATVRYTYACQTHGGVGETVTKVDYEISAGRDSDQLVLSPLEVITEPHRGGDD
jgi:hypothetical protein